MLTNIDNRNYLKINIYVNNFNNITLLINSILIIFLY